MRERIHASLLTAPIPSYAVKQLTHAVMDGTCFDGKYISAFVALDAKIRRALYWDYGTRENQHDLVGLFERMRNDGCTLVSATIDGNPAIARALRRVWPNIRIQRCLVHVQRQGLMWCRFRPNRTDAIHLRKLFMNILSIETRSEAEYFLSGLEGWERRFGEGVDNDESHGWVVSDLRRARSMLLKARPFLFTYLDDPDIPRTTNMAEGFFSRFKGLLRSHRGMNRLHRQRAFEWFCVKCR